MTNLKTINDLQCTCKFCSKYNHKSDLPLMIETNELRQEAIKHIKELDDCKVPEPFEWEYTQQVAIIQWIKYFFNIKEEN